MRYRESLEERRREFDTHLWDHTADPFQSQLDLRRPLTDDELQALKLVTRVICDGKDDEAIATELHDHLRRNPELMYIFMQIAGLTRNKILTDLRASTAAAGLKIPGDSINLVRSASTWAVAGPYLAFRVRRVLEPLCTDEPTEGAFEAINQATWPHWVRQQRAKLQGHEAEFRIATLLAGLGFPFQPAEKADNPLCRDAVIGGISFDIVVPEVASPRICVKSTVQTANIGQFGESKGALEVTEAIQVLRNQFGARPPVLLAMVDGIGFRSNTAGLHGILSNADEFCQFATLWKAAAISASALGRRIAIAPPKEDMHRHAVFLDRYAEALEVTALTDEFRAEKDAALLIEAGEALIRPIEG